MLKFWFCFNIKFTNHRREETYYGKIYLVDFLCNIFLEGKHVHEQPKHIFSLKTNNILH